jgi:hypothetical protein
MPPSAQHSAAFQWSTSGRSSGKAERLTNNPRWYDGLPMRAQTYLHNAGLAALPEAEAAAAVARLSRRERLAKPNIGKGAAAALTAWLARHGHTFSQSPHPATVGFHGSTAHAGEKHRGPM